MRVNEEKNLKTDSDYYNGDLGIDISGWLLLMWSNRFLFVVIVTVFLVLGVVIALLLPKKYTAVATILPPQITGQQMSRIPSGLGEIIGNLVPEIGETAIMIYPHVSTSRNVLIKMLNAQYKDKTFRELLQTHYHFNEHETENLINILQKEIVKASIEKSTGVMTLNITYYDPELAAELANEILNQMEDYFKYHFRSVATSQSLMIKQRLNEVSDSLKISENRLLEFRESNRATNLSPKLQIFELRLTREVEVNSTLYVELTSQLELAKISELQLKPILNILDKAVPPIKKSGPPRRKIVLAFMIAGFLSTLAYIKISPTFKKKNTKMIDISNADVNHTT